MVRDYKIKRFLGYDGYNDPDDLKAGYLSRGTKGVLVKGGRVVKGSGLDTWPILFGVNHVLSITGLYRARDSKQRERLVWFSGDKAYSIDPLSLSLSSNIWTGTDKACGVFLDFETLNDIVVVAAGESVPLRKYTVASDVFAALGGTPPALEGLCLHKNRIFGFLGSSVWYCAINDPEGAWAEIKVDLNNRAQIVAIKEIGAQLFIFKDNKAYRLDTYADSVSGWKVEPVPDQISGVLKGGVFNIPDHFTVVATRSGIYAFNGASFELISEAINDDLAAIDYLARRACFFYDEADKLLGFNYVPDNIIKNFSLTDATGSGSYLFPFWKNTVTAGGTVTQQTAGTRKYARLLTSSAGDAAKLSTLPFKAVPAASKVEYIETTTADFEAGTLVDVTASANSLKLNAAYGIDPCDTAADWVSGDAANFTVSLETADKKQGAGAIKVAALANWILDQSQTSDTYGIGYWDTSQGAGNTFTAQMTGNLKRVLLPLGRTGSGPDFKVQVRTTSGGLPTGTILAETAVAAASIGSKNWYQIEFATPAAVTAGTMYAITIVITGSGNTLFWYGNNNQYLSGTRVDSYNGGATWSADIYGFDFGFKTYIYRDIADYHITRDFGAGATKDYSAVNNLKFWVKMPSGNYRLSMGEATSEEQTFNFTITTEEANTWVAKTWDISGIAAASRDAIRYVRLRSLTERLDDTTILFDCFESIGTRTSPVINIATNDLPQISSIAWNATLDGQSLTIETALSLDDGQSFGAWLPAASGQPIPGITAGMDLSRARLKLRETLTSADATKLPMLDDLTFLISREALEFYLSVMHNRLTGNFTNQATYKVITHPTYDEAAGTTQVTGYIGNGTAATWTHLGVKFSVAPDAFMRLEFESIAAGAGDVMSLAIDDVVLTNAATGQGFVYSILDKTWIPQPIQLSSAVVMGDLRVVGAPLNKNPGGYHVTAYVFTGDSLLGSNLDSALVIGPTDFGARGKKLLSYLDIVCKETGSYNLEVTVTNEKGASVTRTLSLLGSDPRATKRVLIGLPGEHFTIKIADNSTNPAFEIFEMVAFYKGGR